MSFNLHGAIMGIGEGSKTVKICDAKWWQIHRYVQFIVWCIQLKKIPVLFWVFVEDRHSGNWYLAVELY